MGYMRHSRPADLRAPSGTAAGGLPRVSGLGAVTFHRLRRRRPDRHSRVRLRLVQRGGRVDAGKLPGQRRPATDGRRPADARRLRPARGRVRLLQLQPDAQARSPHRSPPGCASSPRRRARCSGFSLLTRGRRRTCARRPRPAGVDPERLVFARWSTRRRTWADIVSRTCFLDTHRAAPTRPRATRSVAGLPVLTWPGDSFAGRVSASLLGAIGLPELVVASLDDYEQTAIALARDRQRLRALRARLEANRVDDAAVRHRRFHAPPGARIREMHARRLRGSPPAAFAVA